MTALMGVRRTTHTLDSEWEFVDVRRDSLHAGRFTLSIAEAIVLRHRLNDVLTDREKNVYCPTCGAAPETFVGELGSGDSDCPKCNPVVCCNSPHSCCAGHR